MQQCPCPVDLDQLLLDPHPGGVDGVAHHLKLLQGRVRTVLLQPEPLAQHFLHGVADRVLVAAHDGLDLDPRRPQAFFKGIGRIQDLNDGILAAAAATADGQGQSGDNGGDGEQQQDSAQTGISGGTGMQSAAGPRAGQITRFHKGLGLTAGAPTPNIPPLMSAEIPESRVPDVLDAWRMVAARRVFEGSLPLSSMTRLRDVLYDDEGVVRFALEFDRDAFQVPYVELRIDAALPLECQRTLQRFLQPVQLVQRLGLIRDESDEAGLPEGYEPLLLPDDGLLHPADLVEDELILAVPVVPAMPGTEAMEKEWPVQAEELEQANPFSALARLKPSD